MLSLTQLDDNVYELRGAMRRLDESVRYVRELPSPASPGSFSLSPLHLSRQEASTSRHLQVRSYVVQGRGLLHIAFAPPVHNNAPGSSGELGRLQRASGGPRGAGASRVVTMSEGLYTVPIATTAKLPIILPRWPTSRPSSAPWGHLAWQKRGNIAKTSSSRACECLALRSR